MQKGFLALCPKSPKNPQGSLPGLKRSICCCFFCKKVFLFGHQEISPIRPKVGKKQNKVGRDLTCGQQQTLQILFCRKGPKGPLNTPYNNSLVLPQIHRILVVGKQKKISSTSNYRVKFDIDMFLCTVVAFLSTHCFLQLSTRRLLLRVENYSRKFFFSLSCSQQLISVQSLREIMKAPLPTAD